MSVAEDTRRRLQAVAAEIERLRAERDLLIGQRRAEGASLQTIGAEAALTGQGVLQVLRRQGAAER